jgi:ribosomal protein S6--L-glutamate ligase
VLVQQYIYEAKGQDLRCFVIGDKVIATMQRTAQEGEFRANIHLGASGKMIKITHQEEEIAIKASKLLGLQIAGVDMVRSADGLKILEVNSSPGLEGIEKATQLDIGKEIISHIVSVIKKL